MDTRMGVNSDWLKKRVRGLYRKANTMARSKGVTISVKVPINWESMTARTKKRLRQTIGRDTRVIRAFLGIIEQHEDELLTGRNRDRISDGDLDQLTMTALQVKRGIVRDQFFLMILNPDFLESHKMR